MCLNRSLAAELATTIGLISLLVFPARSMAQTTAAPAAPQGLQCNGTPMFDPFKGRLAGPSIPAGLLPIDAANRDKVLKSGLPCQENARPIAQGDPAGNEANRKRCIERIRKGVGLLRRIKSKAPVV